MEAWALQLRAWRRPRLVLRALLAAAALGLGATACADHDVPSALLGRWTTADPRYAGRSLSITPATIEFAQDAANRDSFLIEGVESEPLRDGATLHVVHYRKGDGPIQMVRLQTDRRSPPALRFENHKEIWTHEGGGGTPTRGGS